MHVPHYEPTPVSDDDDLAFGIFCPKAIHKTTERWG
jgi:hypothetical protein